MLEIEVYDNFNRNQSVEIDNNFINIAPNKKPKAIGVILDYELFVTGHDYTSSGTVSCPVEVGDMILVKTPTRRKEPIQDGNYSGSPFINILYLVTAVETGNKVTLQNFFWAMIENLQVPQSAYFKGSQAQDYLSFILWSLDITRTNYVARNWFYNRGLVDSPSANLPLPRYGFKAESIDLTEVFKKLQDSFQYMYRVDLNWQYAETRQDWNSVSYYHEWYNNTGIEVGINISNYIETRVDESLNIVSEDVVYIERSNYNRVTAYYKPTDPDDPTQPVQDSDYILPPLNYTILEDGTIVDTTNYVSPVAGLDMPSQVFGKTVFFDIKPTEAQIRAEISGDTTLKKFTFDLDEKLPLELNDRVNLWYGGKNYYGYICDMVYTENSIRLVFLESTNVIE